MKVPLIPVVNSDVGDAVDDANLVIGLFNDYAQSDAARMRNTWIAFWDAGRSLAYMQAKIDAMAENVFEGVDGKPTNALTVFFAAAVNEIADVQRILPDAFADAKVDTTGQLKQYFTPGWTFKIDDKKPSGMALIGPPEWVD